MRALVVLAVVAWAGVAQAHLFKPAVIEIQVGDGEHRLRVRAAENQVAAVRSPCELRDGVARCPLTELVAGVTVPGAREVFLDLRWPDGRRELRSPAREAPSFVRLGVEHIAGGVDHLLFVVGLLALAGSARKLIATITAFTVGHSLTLAAISLGWLRPSQPAVEVLVAATLLFLAVALVSPEARAMTGARLALVFGLVHGGGFAGALADVGLPSLGAVALFNVGVELGQLLVVAAALLLPRPRRGIGYALGVTAVVLVLERLPLLVAA